ncbi:CU044_2847 family protein [Actinoplanes sp. NPDC049802]|uniref:CU044_2847 family protein n=1 Tax=Actinoplanes sp. NPDC049802 TaxID=3154742 RepID=UPI003409F3FA
MTEPTDVPDSVSVQVVDVSSGRQISWGGNAVERLSDRLGDVRAAIIAGAGAINIDFDTLPAQHGWEVGEVSATFGVTLAAEAGVVLSKAAMEATFEVTVTLQRK